MKQTTKVPVEIFVSRSLSHSRILKIIEPWNMEPEFIISTILTYFKRIGIENIHPLKESDSAIDLIVVILKNSPELKKRIAEIQRNSDEAQQRRKRFG